MIRFFRNIRQKLLAQGNIGKYLGYAVGEIILVVIGILIALQINNWNENKKIAATVDNYLAQLVSDLEADKSYYKQSISSLQSNLMAYDSYKKIYAEPGLNSAKVIEHIYQLEFDHNPIEFRTSTIKTLISTGEIKLIPAAIRDQLILYDTRQSHVKLSTNSYNESSKEMLQSAMSKGANSDLLMRLQKQPEFSSYLGIENHFPEIVVEVEAYIAWKEFGEKQTISAFESLIKDADAMITSINEELEK